MDEHEPPGQRVPPLKLADGRLRHGERRRRRHPPHGEWRRGGEVQHEQQARRTRRVRTCTQIARSMFPSRSTTSGSPACGPALVTNVPVTTTSSVSAAKSKPIRSPRENSSAPAPRSTRASPPPDDDRAASTIGDEEVRHHRLGRGRIELSSARAAPRPPSAPRRRSRSTRSSAAGASPPRRSGSRA